MSTVQEIQHAIAELPMEDRLGLIDWIHAQQEGEIDAHDPKLTEQAEQGARELDAGQAVPLDEVRKLTSTWTSK